jgi:hypothetical protein
MWTTLKAQFTALRLKSLSIVCQSKLSTTPQDHKQVKPWVCVALALLHCLRRDPSVLHERVLSVMRLLGPRHWASWRLLLLGVELHCGALEEASIRAQVITSGIMHALGAWIDRSSVVLLCLRTPRPLTLITCMVGVPGVLSHNGFTTTGRRAA